MAQHLPTRKSTVDLSKSGGVRVSRIRRDPPPAPAKLLTREELRRREARAIAVGSIVFALSLFVVLMAFNIGPSWEAKPIHIVIED